MEGYISKLTSGSWFVVVVVVLVVCFVVWLVVWGVVFFFFGISKSTWFVQQNVCFHSRWDS